MDAAAENIAKLTERRRGAGVILEDAGSAPQLMESVPKPVYLDISFVGEAQLARRSPDDFYLSVSVRWRRAESIPPILQKPQRRASDT